MKRACLVVFTGIDGSGKTTQAKLLVDWLHKDGKTVSYVWCRWEPFLVRPLIKIWKSKVTKSSDKSNSDFNNKIKANKKTLMGNPVFRNLWLGVFFIDYALQIFYKIRIKLFNKHLLISDRMFYDSLIDQAINLGDRKEWLLGSLDSFWMKVIFPHPDLVIYVDCPADVAFLRKDDAPNVEYLIERRNLYLKLADRYNWTKIDGTLHVDEIATHIKDILYKEFNFILCQKQ